VGGAQKAEWVELKKQGRWGSKSIVGSSKSRVGGAQNQGGVGLKSRVGQAQNAG